MTGQPITMPPVRSPWGDKPRPLSRPLPARGASTVVESLRRQNSEESRVSRVTPAPIPGPKPPSPPRRKRGKKPAAPCRFTQGSSPCQHAFNLPPAFAEKYPSIRSACDFADRFKSHRWVYACRLSHTKKMSETDFFKLLQDRFNRLPSKVSYLGVTAKSSRSGWSHVHFVIDCAWDVFAPLFRLPKLNGLGFHARRTWRKKGGAVYPGGARGFLHYICEDGMNVFSRIVPRSPIRVSRGPDLKPRRVRANSTALAIRANEIRWSSTTNPKGARA